MIECVFVASQLYLMFCRRGGEVQVVCKDLCRGVRKKAITHLFIMSRIHAVSLVVSM